MTTEEEMKNLVVAYENEVKRLSEKMWKSVSSVPYFRDLMKPIKLEKPSDAIEMRVSTYGEFAVRRTGSLQKLVPTPDVSRLVGLERRLTTDESKTWSAALRARVQATTEREHKNSIVLCDREFEEWE